MALRLRFASLRPHAQSTRSRLCAVPVDVNDPREVDEMERLNAQLVRRALRLGGTCTGEHGIGMGKVGVLFFSF